MKLDKYTERDKEIIRAVKEMDALRKVSREAPLIPLSKPYQNGWIRYYVLRDDYTRRSDAQVFHTMIGTVGTEIFSRKIDFLDRKGQERHPGLRVIGKREWEVLNWPASHTKYFRYGKWHEKNIWGYSTAGVEGYKMERPFFFIEAVRPHFVTHTKTIYPDIESRMKYLQNKFEKHQLWHRYGKLKGGVRWSYDWATLKKRYMDALSTLEIEKYDPTAS